MSAQKERVRALTWCPRCFEAKDTGLLLCWPCHRTLKKRHDGGYGKTYEVLLDHLDALLEHSTPEDMLAALQRPPVTARGNKPNGGDA